MENKNNSTPKLETIQEKMDRLDSIITEIQSSDGTLENKLSYYQEGKKLIKELEEKFNEIHIEIDKINEK